LYYESKKYEEAVKHYNDAIAGKFTDVDYAYYQRGVVYGILDKISEAKGNLDVVINRFPQSIYHDDAIFEKAQLNSQIGNFDETISGFTKIIREKEGSPYVPYALLKRAVAYTNVNKDAEAIADYENILTHYVAHPVAGDAFVGLQGLYEKTGRTEEFKKWIDVMEKIDPKNSLLISARFTDAKNLYFAQKYPQAAEAFLNYLNSYPESANSAEARYYLAESYAGANELDNALKQYKLIVEAKEPTYYVKSIQKIADIQFKRGAYPEAKTYYGLLLANARNKKDKSIALNGLMESNYISQNYDSTISCSHRCGEQSIIIYGKIVLCETEF
jgi:TolA-binding protein